MISAPLCERENTKLARTGETSVVYNTKPIFLAVSHACTLLVENFKFFFVLKKPEAKASTIKKFIFLNKK